MWSSPRRLRGTGRRESDDSSQSQSFVSAKADFNGAGGGGGDDTDGEGEDPLGPGDANGKSFCPVPEIRGMEGYSFRVVSNFTFFTVYCLLSVFDSSYIEIQMSW